MSKIFTTEEVVEQIAQEIVELASSCNVDLDTAMGRMAGGDAKMREAVRKRAYQITQSKRRKS